MEYTNFTKAPTANVHISMFVKFIYCKYKYNVAKLFTLRISCSTVGK